MSGESVEQTPAPDWRRELAEGPQPCFVIGSGRCGSTLLYRLLSRHPRVAMTNESGVVNFLHFVNELAAQPHSELREYALRRPTSIYGIIGADYAPNFSDELLACSGQMLLNLYRRQFPGKRWTWFGDKLTRPEAVVALRALFPGLRTFLMVRDPRDVVCSMRTFGARESVQAGNPVFSAAADDLQAYCRRWVMLYQRCQDWLPGMLALRYEDLVFGDEAALARVMAHLGLDVHAAQRDVFGEVEARRCHATTASVAESVGRWRRDLTADEVAVVEELCAPVMAAYGYERGGGAG
ncbi:MAG: sulfotransferase family protein [Planctomycetota bacterium]